MKKYLLKFSDSSKELGKVQSLAGCAMMLALRIVLGILANSILLISPLPYVKISLAFIPVIITAFLYGPVCAGIVAGLGDILTFFIVPAGPWLPGITACCILEGVIYGIFLYETELEIKSLIYAKIADLAICTITLNSLVLFLLYKSDLNLIFLYRTIVLVPFAVAEVFVIWLLKPLLLKIKRMNK